MCARRQRHDWGVRLFRTGSAQHMSGIYKARRNLCSDGRRTNVHRSSRTRALGDKHCLSATHNIHGAAIRNRQCARANTIRRFELAEGKTSLTMATDLAVREPWKNRWIRFDR